MQRRGHAVGLVAILIDARDEHGQDALDRGRLTRDRAGQIVVVERRAEVVVETGLISGTDHAGNLRKLPGHGGGRQQLPDRRGLDTGSAAAPSLSPPSRPVPRSARDGCRPSGWGSAAGCTARRSAARSGTRRRHRHDWCRACSSAARSRAARCPAVAAVPTSPGDMRSPQNSVAPNASITFGQVFVLVHRSSRLAARRGRAWHRCTCPTTAPVRCPPRRVPPRRLARRT